jgi:hypothetical protein
MRCRRGKEAGLPVDVEPLTELAGGVQMSHGYRSSCPGRPKGKHLWKWG